MVVSVVSAGRSRYISQESDCHALLLLGFTSATLSIHDLNFAWACFSWVNELVRCVNSCDPDQLRRG